MASSPVPDLRQERKEKCNCPADCLDWRLPRLEKDWTGIWRCFMLRDGWAAMHVRGE